jgi:phospholipase A1
MGSIDTRIKISTLLLRSLGLALLMLASPLVMSHETSTEHSADESGSLVVDRIERERAVQDNRSVLLAHKRNYVLPLTYANQPNDDVFEIGSSDFGQDLDNAEIQFQVSLKAPLAEDLFTEQDRLFVGFTVRSFWQAYNDELSSPFRETNYEPEIFWVTPVPWTILGGDASLFGLGLTHQSNGRSQLFSRSWNRVYAYVVWERWRYVFQFKVWGRISEDEKDDPLDPDGDDNPDIEDYLGNFEFTTAYRQNDHEVSVMLRNNLESDDNRGAIQIDWTFPLQRRFRGYVQFFNGYGESLIDYDAHIERLGIGILLSDLL